MTALRYILDILFPRRCQGCERALSATEKPWLCGSCVKSLRSETAFVCAVCSGRIPLSPRRLPPLRNLCHPRSPYLLLALARYENPVARKLARELKFRRHARVAEELGQLLAERVAGLAGNFDLIVPIPLSARRLRERGFNQAQLLAEETSKRIQTLPVETVLRRIRHGKPQTLIRDWGRRRENMRGSFEVVSPELVRGKNIIIIDDVWTSGATMNAAARAIKSAGARRLLALVVARAR